MEFCWRCHLATQQRQWNLRNREREAHSYAKSKNTYYDEEVKQDKKSTKAREISNQVKLKLNYIHHNPQAHLTLTFSKMSIKQLTTELKHRNAKGFSQKNKAELIKQLKEICECESTNLRQSAD